MTRTGTHSRTAWRGLTQGSFDIDAQTGQIRTKAGITYDHETQATYSVMLRAMDPLGASGTIIVAVEVTDVNEKPGFSSDADTTRSIPENTPPGRDVGAPLTASDPDGDPLMHSLEGSDATSFDIDAQTGQIRTKAGVSYDYETKSSYSVTIRAMDPLGVSNAIIVTVEVTDVDEKPATPAAPAVRAPAGSSTSLWATWIAPDRNGGPPIIGYDVEYRQGMNGEWIPWSHIGTITTITGLMAHTDYQVRVRALNGELPSDWSPPGSGQSNNTTPAFGRVDVARSLPENTPPGEDVGVPLTATDDDGDTLTYSLEDTDAALFDIDAQSGQIKTKAGVTYDYETKASYSLTARASDLLNASDILALNIRLTDVDEKPATPAAPTVRAPAGSSTSLRVTWTAPDRNGGPPLTGYDVEYRQDSSGGWTAWPHDGIGTNTTITELMAHTDYQVRVRALNGEAPSDWSPPGSGRTNNTTPAFESAATTRSFPENTPPGQDIGEPLTATDADSDKLTYSLEGPDAAAFNLDPDTGQLRTQAAVTYDHEVRDSYSVTVRATDPLGISDTIIVAVGVMDVDEKPAAPAAPLVTALDGSSTSLRVTWTAPDRNGGPPLTGYDVEYRQDSSGGWTAWPHDGIGTNTTITELMAHTDYQVRVRALNGEAPSDWSPPGSGRTNNTTPAFESATTTRSFPENTPPGQDIGEPLTATDADSDKLTYSLEGPDAAAFNLDPDTGQLRTQAAVTYDHEVRDSYFVTVRATDPLGTSDTIIVAVGVMDVDEKPAAPAAPLVTALDGSSTSLRVTWTAPDRNGGPPLTGYDVEYRQDSSGDWTAWPHSGTHTVTTITGLSTSTGYQVRVRALNGEAPSDWSLPGSGQTNATLNGWLARFGRTVAQHVLDGVEPRLTSSRRPGFQGIIAGRGFGGTEHAAPHGTGYGLALRDSLERALSPWIGGDPEMARLLGSRFLTEHGLLSGTGQEDLLTASAFELSGEAARGGIVGAWGRGGLARFDGSEAGFSLDGSVTTGTLGADYAKDPWVAGLALSHSQGTGTYGRAHSRDDMDASLTGLYPYAGFKVTKGFSVWGVGGYGQGTLTLTPENGVSIETDIGLAMAAVGARGMLFTAANGFDIALETDGFWVRTTSEKVLSLLAAETNVTRLRLGLESSYTAVLHKGGTLTPRFEVGLRHDGGDAETGLGVEIGGGVIWSTPARGISVGLEGRSLVAHQADEFRDWGASGLLRFDPNPSSDRGLSASFQSSVGLGSLNATNALLGYDNLTRLAAPGASQGRYITAEAAYGFPILSGRFTGAPWAGIGMLENGRDYRLGYRISSAGPSSSGMQLSIEGVRRENNHGDREAEHAIDLRLGLDW